MELKEIAAISGKEGLFRILKPARSGIIVETLDAQKRKIAVGVSEKVSILKEISIYTTTQEGSISLEEVLYKMHEKYQGSLPISAKADSADLMAFLQEVLPEYNSEKVYPSDVKKLVKWYEILFRQAPDVLVRKEETPATETEVQRVDNTPAQTTEIENKSEELVTEEKLKKTRSTKKKTETSEVENKIKEPATEEKPKKTRSAKKKTDTTQEQETVLETEKPKKKSTQIQKEA